MRRAGDFSSTMSYVAQRLLGKQRSTHRKVLSDRGCAEKVTSMMWLCYQRQSYEKASHWHSVYTVIHHRPETRRTQAASLSSWCRGAWQIHGCVRIYQDIRQPTMERPIHRRCANAGNAHCDPAGAGTGPPAAARCTHPSHEHTSTNGQSTNTRPPCSGSSNCKCCIANPSQPSPGHLIASNTGPWLGHLLSRGALVLLIIK